MYAFTDAGKPNPKQTQFKANQTQNKPKTNPIPPKTQFSNFSYLCHSRESGNPSLEATVLTYAIYRTAILLDKSTENAHPQDRQSEIGNRKSNFIPKSPIIARNQRCKFISIPLTLYPKPCYLPKNSILNSKPVLSAAEGFNILNSKSVNFGYLPDCFTSYLF